jgi:tagatose 6-phosphate kinase
MIITLGTTPAFARTMVFDEVVADDVNRTGEVYEHAAGKAVNVAKVVRTLGEEVVAMGFLGGETGRFIRAQLDALGVKHAFVEVPAKTRTCVTVIDDSNGQTTELIEEATPVEAPKWADLRRAFADLVTHANMVVLSGSLPPDAPSDFYAECIRLAHGANVRCVVDATGEPLGHAIVEKPYLIKPNEDELADTTGVPIDSDVTLREGLRQVLQGGASWCLVSRGGDPAILAGAEPGQRPGAMQIRPPVVEVVSTIGSGDATAAGVVVALARGMSMPDAARLGIACGSANAKTLIAGLVKFDDVFELHPQVQIDAW